MDISRVKFLQKLIEEKDLIEEQVKEITEWLESPGNYGLKGGLVDQDGFPLDDVEKIIAVRKARGKLAYHEPLSLSNQGILQPIHPCLTNDLLIRLGLINDHLECMEKIEKGLLVLKEESGLERERKQPDQFNMAITTMLSSSQHSPSLAKENDIDSSEPCQKLAVIGSDPYPIALVNKVFPLSPAAKAGLCSSDQLITISHLNSNNIKGLQCIASVVNENENKEITVTIRRKINQELQDLTLKLVPSIWTGHGLFGCHLLLPPISSMNSDPDQIKDS